MATFKAVITAVQSADGKTLTLTDASPYGNNNENYVVATFSTRTIVLTASDNSVLATITLGSALTATFALTKDQYITATLNLGTTGPYTTYINLGLERNTQNLYQNILAPYGCCANKAVEEKLEQGDIFFRGADIAFISGNGPAFDSNISSAYAYLNS